MASDPWLPKRPDRPIALPREYAYEPFPAAPGSDLHRAALAGVGLVFIALIALLDYRTGPYLSLSILYLIPVAACSWWGGFAHGTLLALGGSVAWYWVDSLENPLMPPPVGVWNGVTRFGTLVLAASLVSRLHAGVLRERRLARTDPLTGAANGRTFYEAAAAEADRARRTGRPLTLAYFDLDNFKQLNDRFGHSAGDEALLLVVETIRTNVRALDVLARLGGDEFALLLPETDTEGAVTLLRRLQRLVSGQMAAKGWPVTLSIGAVTFLRPAWDVDVMVRRVDEMMYGAKRKGKDRIEHTVVQDPQSASSGGGSGVERRATARLVCNSPANVRAEEGGREVFATVRDISAGGVGLILSESFPPGAVLVVEPMMPSAQTLLARVVYSCPAEGGWLHGCELSTRLDDARLHGWAESQSEQPS